MRLRAKRGGKEGFLGEVVVFTIHVQSYLGLGMASRESGDRVFRRAKSREVSAPAV